MNSNGFYYDYSKINSYHCPVKIIISRRGLGKTFGKLKQYTERFVTKGDRFIYVVETGDMVKELTRNNGEKFWSAILKYYSDCDTSRKRYFYKKLTELQVINEEEEEGGLIKRDVKAKIVGGTIKINGETAGYIVDLNSFGELKRNNFEYVKNVLVDEFISEKMDRTTLQNPRKLTSIIQSIARLKNIEICLLGNSVRLDDPILSRMGFQLKRFGYYYYRDEYGLFAVLHFVDPSEYPIFDKAHNESVSGRLSKMLGETNEEENRFLENLPKNRRLNVFRYKKGGLSLNLVKDENIVTIREMEDGIMGCIPFSGKNVQNLFCLTEKEQGYKMGYHIICNKSLKQMIFDMLKAGIIYYYSEIEYTILKNIIKGD